MARAGARNSQGRNRMWSSLDFADFKVRDLRGTVFAGADDIAIFYDARRLRGKGQLTLWLRNLLSRTARLRPVPRGRKPRGRSLMRSFVLVDSFLDLGACGLRCNGAEHERILRLEKRIHELLR
jgi:hypothetical protein